MHNVQHNIRLAVQQHDVCSNQHVCANLPVVAVELAPAPADTAVSASANLPIERDTPFQIQSMITPVVASAALILVADGKLQLNAPVSRYIPAFAHGRSREIKNSQSDESHKWISSPK
jgi:hypothetical protein